MRNCHVIAAAVVCLGAFTPLAASDAGDLTVRIAAGKRAFTPEEVLGFVAGHEPLFKAGTG